MSMWVYAPFIGVAIGLALAMLGGGGSILTVPALVYLLNQDSHNSIATSLVIVGANATIGALIHYRNGHVLLRQAIIFGLWGLLAAFYGAKLSQAVDDHVLLVLFAILMLVIATLMLRGRKETNESQAPISHIRVMLGGLTVGFLTGFLGVGGGFLIVPALVFLMGMDIRHAVGSSLVVIAMNCVAGLAGHISTSTLNWTLIAVLLAGGLFGIYLGTQLAKRMQTTQLRRSFAGFVVVLGLILLIINIPYVFS